MKDLTQYSKKLKAETAGPDEILLKVWKIRKFDDIYRLYNALYKQKTRKK